MVGQDVDILSWLNIGADADDEIRETVDQGIGVGWDRDGLGHELGLRTRIGG